MATKNNITGDTLITKVNNKNYEDNYDKIFGRKQNDSKQDDLDNSRSREDNGVLCEGEQPK